MPALGDHRPHARHRAPHGVRRRLVGPHLAGDQQGAVGTISQVTMRRMSSVPRRAPERTSENRRASAVTWLA